MDTNIVFPRIPFGLIQSLSSTVLRHFRDCSPILAVFAFLFLSATFACAETAGVDGVTFKDDQLYVTQGDKLSPAETSISLPFEVEVETNGTFKVAGGKERKLERGQVILRDGWLVNTDGSVQPVYNHVAITAGKVLSVLDGQSAAISRTLVFTNGCRVEVDGWLIYPSGKRLKLIDGELFRLDGTSIPSKDAATLIGGKVVVQKAGTLITLPPVQIMGMDDGSRILGTGSIKKIDGATIMLREGKTVLLDGTAVSR